MILYFWWHCDDSANSICLFDAEGKMKKKQQEIVQAFCIRLEFLQIPLSGCILFSLCHILCIYDWQIDALTVKTVSFIKCKHVHAHAHAHSYGRTYVFKMLHNPYDGDNIFEMKKKHQQNQQQSIATNWKRNTEQNKCFTKIWYYGIYVSEYDLFICFVCVCVFLLALHSVVSEK